MAMFTIAQDITVEGFFSVVSNADWFYGFSDDLSVFKSGEQKCDTIEAFAKQKGGVYLKIFLDYQAYNSKLTGSSSATARQPQWKDYAVRTDVTKPTIASVRHATREQIAEYLAARADDNVELGKELEAGEMAGRDAAIAIKKFSDERLYDANIARVIRIKDLAVFTPAKGQHGACYAIKEGRGRIDAFPSPGYFRAFMLKYYF